MINLNPNKIAQLYNLKNLKRYNTRSRIKDESVAEHSYYVTLFAMFICDYLEVSNTIKLLVNKIAISHDIPEIEISDVPYPTKQKYPDIKVLLDLAEKDVLNNVFNNFDKFYIDSKSITNLVLVESIVKIADKLSVYQFAQLEISLGNKSMKTILDDTRIEINIMLNQFKDNNPSFKNLNLLIII